MSSKPNHLNHGVLWGHQVFARFDRYAMKIDDDTRRVLKRERFHLGVLRDHDFEKE
jgi:hypothetical protein